MTPFQKNRFKQITAIENAIQASINGLPQRQEPDYIAYLTNNLPAELQKVLGAGYNVASAFLHQRPLAKILNPSNRTGANPEIGALLLVYNDAGQYNALLLQAKKGSVNTPFPVKRKDSHQLELYKDWPDFEYARAGELNGKRIYLSPKVAHPGAQYLVIDNSQPNNVQFGCANASSTILTGMSFAEAICDLIHFQTGRTIAPYRGRLMNFWSILIWDLIWLSLSKVFNRNTIGLSNQPRLNDPNKAFLCLCRFGIPNIRSDDYDDYINGLSKRLKRRTIFDRRNQNECVDEPSEEHDDDTGVNLIFIQKTTEKNQG